MIRPWWTKRSASGEGSKHRDGTPPESCSPQRAASRPTSQAIASRPGPLPGALAAGWIAAVALLLANARRLVFTNDEGIILDAAQRMLGGQMLYNDFFSYMSPGGYWLQWLVFHAFGVSIWSARLLPILDLAGLTAMVYWLAFRLGGRSLAVAGAALFFVLLAAQPGMVTAQHRWDSALLTLAGIVAAVEGALREGKRASLALWFLSGVLLSFACLVTPSIAGIAAVTAGWALADRRLRLLFPALAAGGATVAVLAAGAMAWVGILGGFLDQLAWLRANYTEVNIMPYGAVIGGYGALFQGVPAAEVPLRAAIVLYMALPAILPPLALAGGLAMAHRARGPARSVLIYLALCTAAYVASTLPRPDVMHLAFVSALPFALCAAWLESMAGRRLRLLLLAPLGALSLLFAVNWVREAMLCRLVESPVGRLAVLPQDEVRMNGLFRAVKPGDSLFVHPYMPLFYFLTQAQNPTRFSYLQPGLMKKREEAIALDELRRSPPAWILWLPLDRAELLRVFPHAGELPHRFENLESWMAENYVGCEKPLVVAGYRLMRRRDSAPHAGCPPASRNAPTRQEGASASPVAASVSYNRGNSPGR